MTSGNLSPPQSPVPRTFETFDKNRVLTNLWSINADQHDLDLERSAVRKRSHWRQRRSKTRRASLIMAKTQLSAQVLCSPWPEDLTPNVRD